MPLKKSERKIFAIRRAVRDRVRSSIDDDDEKPKKAASTKAKRPPKALAAFLDEIAAFSESTAASWEAVLEGRFDRFLRESKSQCAVLFPQFFDDRLRKALVSQCRAFAVSHAKGSCAELERVSKAFAGSSDLFVQAVILAKSEAERRERFLRVSERKSPTQKTKKTKPSKEKKPSKTYPSLLRSLLADIGVEHTSKVLTEILLGLEKKLVDAQIPLDRRPMKRTLWWMQTKSNLIRCKDWASSVLNGPDAKIWAWRIGNEFDSDSYSQFSEESAKAKAALEKDKADRESASNIALLNSYLPKVDGVYKCGKCKSTTTQIYQQQTRSADEPMTVFIRCAKCGNRWKQ